MLGQIQLIEVRQFVRYQGLSLTLLCHSTKNIANNFIFTILLIVSLNDSLNNKGNEVNS